MNEPDLTEGSPGAGAKAASPAIYTLIDRWQTDHWPAQDKAHIQTGKCRPSSDIEVNSPIAACSSFLCTLRPKRLPPIRNTCSSGSRSPSGLPSRPSDVSATPELLTPPGFHLWSPVFGFIGTAELVLMLPEWNASSYEHWKRLWPVLRSAHAQRNSGNWCFVTGMSHAAFRDTWNPRKTNDQESRI